MANFSAPTPHVRPRSRTVRGAAVGLALAGLAVGALALPTVAAHLDGPRPDGAAQLDRADDLTNDVAEPASATGFTLVPGVTRMATAVHLKPAADLPPRVLDAIERARQTLEDASGIPFTYADGVPARGESLVPISCDEHLPGKSVGYTPYGPRTKGALLRPAVRLRRSSVCADDGQQPINDIVLHELGHAIGLGHYDGYVHDQDGKLQLQVMSALTHPGLGPDAASPLGQGDLNGIHQLASQADDGR